MLVSTQKNPFFKKLKYYGFLFRWFLIGRYHCRVPRKYRKYYWLINKALWFIIIVGSSQLMAEIVKATFGFK